MKILTAWVSLLFCCVSASAQYDIRESIYFDSDSFTFDKTALAQIQRIKNKLINNPYHRIEIYGNTDSIGELKYNQELSEKRVKSVLAYLLNGGTESKRIIKTAAFGEKSPMADNGNEWGRHKNRRVDIMVQMDHDTCIKDGCAKTCLPKGTFDPAFNHEVKITLVPITNFDQMAQNNISPQTNRGDYLFSNGMMRITSTVNGQHVNPKKNVKISIPAHRIDPDMAIYEGSNGNGPVKWERKTIELKKVNDHCLVYEIDGSWLNKWINMDKPRPAGNMICLDNPFIYLDLPMDGDTNKVIENDIILSFNTDDFEGHNAKAVTVKTGNVANMCDWLKNNITSNTTDGGYLDKNQRVLKINGFYEDGKKVELENLNNFTALFPFKEDKKEPTFYTAERNADGKIIWDNAGKPDSILDLKGCGCKYYVKEFQYPVQYISISTTAEVEKEKVATKALKFKKVIMNELFVYYKKDNLMITLKPNAKGQFDIPLYDKEGDIIVMGKYIKEGEIYYFDERLSNIKPAWFGWFGDTKRMKKSKFKKYDEKKGLKLKNISCTKGKPKEAIKSEKKEDIEWLNDPTIPAPTTNNK
ncbi:MAG: OmpA family protein [Bacteroidota bacterium]